MGLEKILDRLLPPQTYEYPPYDRLKPWQIRVLSLHKNSHGPRISGTLQTIDLIDHVAPKDYLACSKVGGTPQYHAISYAAGDLKNKIRFYCDERIFFIGFNLWQALVRLADLDLPCPIWVDAISINQRDPKEKARQIQQMAEVYKQAQRVWIWLGEARQYTLPAIKEMPRLIKVLTGYDGSRESQHDYDHYFDDSDRPKAKLVVWDGISDLVNRPYFERLWVLQEAFLANRKLFLCGPHAFRWNDFQLLIQHLQRQHLQSFISSITPVTGIDAFDFFLDIDTCNLIQLGLHRSFVRLRDILMVRPCWGSRDKVMAVLGLLNADQQRQIKADARLPKLYANFTSLVLKHDITLTTFTLAGSHRGYDALPSWCPDYHAPEKVVPLSHITSRPPRNVPMAAETSPIVNAPAKMWFQIEVTGYCLDIIDSVAAGGWPKRVSTNESLGIWEAGRALDWETECRKLGGKGLTGWNLEQRTLYARTLIGDAKVFKVPRASHLRELFGIKVTPTAEESSTDPAAHYRYLRPALRKMKDPGTDSEGNTNKPPNAKRFMADVSRMCTGRAFFHTKQGRIGLGASGLWRNDMVCFLEQATVPFILRPNQASKQPGHPPVYHLLGEAYVDDLMEDCAFGIIPPKARQRSFIIE
jgi:hypothetical protein